MLVVAIAVPLHAQGGAASQPDAARAALDSMARAAAGDTARPAPAEPFAFGDFTWLNGSNRQKKSLLETPYFTPHILVETLYTYDFNEPIDNTIVGSTYSARHNEVQVGLATIGGDFHYDHARATLTLQVGTRAELVPRNDGTLLRGQYDLLSALRYVREATAGLHFDVLHGLNVDAGIFMSYVGLASNLGHENWMQQPSFVSDNTPWFFQGVRTQLFPSDRLKLELWITNGWQSYSKFTNGVGLGTQLLWRPREWVSVVASSYWGRETRGIPQRVRWHSDNSVLFRYLNHPDAKGRAPTKGAVSFTFDAGCESGGGVTCGTQNFIGFMAYHRLWFAHDRIGWTVGGGYISNPGRYLVLAPPGPVPFDLSPGTSFNAWDLSTTLDYMPDQHVTFRLEAGYRRTNVPYFNGPGGLTSPDGYTDTPIPAGWQPDRVTSDPRVIAALLVRF